MIFFYLLKDNDVKHLYLILFFILFSISTVTAHPHIYIDMEMSLEVDNNGFNGLWQRWTLLRSFSSDVILDYDLDENGIFDSNEQNLIYEKAFLGVAPYYFFTYINLDGKDFVSLKAEDFSAKIQNNQVIYSFFIPLNIAATKDTKSLDIVTYDPTSYVSFGFQGLIDPYNKNIDYNIEFLRDGGIYSHRNDLGQLHLLIDLKLSKYGEEISNIEKSKNNLELLDNLEPVPIETPSNPFLVRGVWSRSDKRANPFLK